MNLLKKYGRLKFNLEDLFTFRRYINEINKEGYKTLYDYSNYPDYKGDIIGRLALMGGQGTGKTTSIVNALKIHKA